MVGWHHRLNGHEVEQTPGIGDGQGSLACCSRWGCKQLDMTWQLSNSWIKKYVFLLMDTFGSSPNIFYPSILLVRIYNRNYFPTHSNNNRCHPLQAWEPSLSALPQNGTCLSKHKYRKRRQSLCSAFVTEFAKANTQYGLQA